MPAITDVNDLQNMNLDLAGTYWLTNDIDASATVGWNGGQGFAPIGNSGDSEPFTGTFNGFGHIISGLYINRVITRVAPDVYNLGLFGCINGATIRNVSLTGLDYTGTSGGAGTIGKAVGLAGEVINSTISNCHTAGTITNYGDASGLTGTVDVDSVVTNCSAAVNCISTNSAATGFTHSNGGIISNSYATGNTTSATVGGTGYGGGFCWYNLGEITQCHSTGIVIGKTQLGGFCGRNDNIIIRCYAIGNVTGTGDNVGGFVGWNNGGSIDDCYTKGNATGDDYIGGFCGRNSTETITHCYSTGIPSGDTNIGGFCGINTGTITDCFWDTDTSGTAISDGGTGKTTSEMKTKSTFTDVNWDFIVIWFINGITNNGYPFFFAMPPDPLPDSPRATVAVEDKITLECVRNVEMATGGRFYIDEEGNAVYKSRYARNL